jgi:hypothetical protein
VPEQPRGPDTVLESEYIDELLRGPCIGQPLHTLGVGVERRGETPCIGAEFTKHEVCSRVCDPDCERIGGDAREMTVEPQQQRVVVEHLLEVRDDPLRVDGVAREAAPDLVVDPSARHRRRRALHRGKSSCRSGPLVMPQQPFE